MNDNHTNTTKNNATVAAAREAKIEYHAQFPYPAVQCQRKNSMYARIMLDNMAGNSSEMSAISLYLYNHFITEEEKQLSELFFNISKVEMHHLNIFGTLATQLGADPRLWTSRNNQAVYWSPSFNKYPKPLKQMVLHAINQERIAVEKYTKQTIIIKDEKIVENLKRIILDEELHVQILEQYLSQHNL